jgi:hypothetical protein
MRRYHVTERTTGRRAFVIKDEVIGDVCTLPASEAKQDERLLEFPTHADAERWLNRCYVTWSAWSVSEADKPKVPQNWQGFVQPVRDAEHGLKKLGW